MRSHGLCLFNDFKVQKVCIWFNDPSASCIGKAELEGCRVMRWSFEVSHGLGQRCSAFDVQVATLALERNESSGANPCPTCAQTNGFKESQILSSHSSLARKSSSTLLSCSSITALARVSI